MFLPSNYEAPKNSGSNYLRLEDGEAAKFRVMTESPLLGWEVWSEDVEGRKCHRREYTHEGFDSLTSLSPDRPKHFWSLVVWDVAISRLIIWHITQKTIKDALTALSKDSDWGDPRQYDLRVGRAGKGLDTKWTITPVPPIGPPTNEAVMTLRDSPINLAALLTNSDPFQGGAGEDIPF